MKRTILYICDRTKCKNCTPDCKHTTDIKHAKHFKNYCNTFVEDQTLQDVTYDMIYALMRLTEDKNKEVNEE